jgi:hypothetical protein
MVSLMDRELAALVVPAKATAAPALCALWSSDPPLVIKKGGAPVVGGYSIVQ